MRGRVVRGFMLSVVVVVVVAVTVATVSGPVAAQTREPVEAAGVIGRALGGLRALDALSFEDRSVSTLWSGLETVTTGAIVAGTPWRHRMEIATAGETGWRRVVIGEDGWQNLYDGTFRPMKDIGIPVPGPTDLLPFEPMLARQTRGWS